MKAAYDVGVNFFDCAEEYSNGESEIVMGEAVRRFGWKRNDLVISTKVSRGVLFRDVWPPADIIHECSSTGVVPLATTS
jgi:aryl-alcohol dehydrogenase-like predicted oxidoreductase